MVQIVSPIDNNPLDSSTSRGGSDDSDGDGAFQTDPCGWHERRSSIPPGVRLIYDTRSFHMHAARIHALIDYRSLLVIFLEISSFAHPYAREDLALIG